MTEGAWFDAQRGGFIPSALGADLLAAGAVRRGADGRLWRYSGSGLHLPDGEAWAASQATAMLGPAYSKRRVEEVVAWLRWSAPLLPSEPLPLDVLNVANGYLSWRSGALEAHRAEVGATVQIPVAWDPSATCPRATRFMEEALGDAASLGWEVMGYALLTGQPAQVAVLLLGAGANGKSTYLGLLGSLLGEANVSAVPLQRLGERFLTSQLAGKLANLCGDLSAEALRDAATLKALTGGDVLTGEHKGKDPFTFRSAAVPVFSANEVPQAWDQSEGFLRRWLVVPFGRTFAEGERDPMLGDLLRAELPGVLVLAVEGLRRLAERGWRFDLPPSVVEAQRAFRVSVDTAAAFLADNCSLQEGARSAMPGLYAEYRRWCRDEAAVPVSSRAFAAKVRRTYGIQDRMSMGMRYWPGLLSPAPFVTLAKA